MSRRAVACLLAIFAAACSAAPERALTAMQLPAETTQVLLVTTADWSATAATLRRCERTAAGWCTVGDPVPARVGRSGLAWGIGLHVDGDGPQKHEGDGRAPAGIFRLGPAFGYAPEPPPGVDLPYRAAGPRDYFVDDPDSADYNQWRRIADDEVNDPAEHWRSCERMRRDDQQYEFGAVVQHNSDPPIAGRGSAIFLHVWSAPDAATSGCTSMARADLLGVLTWLRDDRQPLLVQVPAAELAHLRARR